MLLSKYNKAHVPWSSRPKPAKARQDNVNQKATIVDALFVYLI